MGDSFKVLRPYLRGFPIILMAMIIGYMIASKYLNYVTPMYESTTKLKLADISEGVNNSNLFKDFDVFATSNKIAAEIEMLKSDVLLNKVLDKLDFETEVHRVGKLRSTELYQDNPIMIDAVDLKPEYYNRKFTLHIKSSDSILLQLRENEIFQASLGDTLKTPYGNFYIRINQQTMKDKPYLKVYDQYQFEILSRNKLISKVKTDLDIMAIDKDVAIIRITNKSPVAQKAALLSNAIAETYIEDYIDSKYKVANVTVNFLQNQINQTLKKLTDAEDKIQSFRNNRGITNIRQENETNLRKISQLKIQQTNLKMSLQAIEELEGYVKNGRDNFLELAPNFEAFTDLLSTEIIKNIKKLQAEKKDLLLVYTPEDERVQVIDDKIDDLKNYLIESISNTKRNLEIKYTELSKQIQQEEKIFLLVPENEKILNILNREFQIYQQSYNFLNEKKIEAEIAQAAKIAFHRIISPASVALNPVSPNKPIIKIVSALLGLFGAIALIFVVHAIKAKVNDSATIESKSMIPIAGKTPKLFENESIIEHFQQLAAEMEIKGLIKNGNMLCFSSFDPLRDAAFNVLEISKAIARQQRKVLLIDVDDQLHISYLESGKTQPVQDYLDVTSLNDPKYKFLSKDQLATFLKELTTGYDLVLIHNEKIGKQLSVMMQSISDVNVIVLDARLTPARYIPKVDLLKEEYKLPQVNFLLNRDGYNPNIITEVYRKVKSFIQKRRKAKILTA